MRNMCIEAMLTCQLSAGVDTGRSDPAGGDNDKADRWVMKGVDSYTKAKHVCVKGNRRWCVGSKVFSIPSPSPPIVIVNATPPGESSAA
jgi:hypothetical protein